MLQKVMLALVHVVIPEDTDKMTKDVNSNIHKALLIVYYMRLDFQNFTKRVWK